MRKNGGVLALLGVLGFFYASARIADLDPLPEGLSIEDTLRQPTGRWMVARYACGTGVLLGLMMLVLPRED